MNNKLNENDLFGVVDACGLRDTPPAPRRQAERKRPDLLELYTRRSRRIEPARDKELGFWTSVMTLFGLYAFLVLMACV